MPFGEFRRRFDILAASQFRNTGPVLDEKKVSELFFFFAIEFILFPTLMCNFLSRRSVKTQFVSLLKLSVDNT